MNTTSFQSRPAGHRRPTALVVLFSVLGAVLIALVLVPVLALILGTSPGSVADALGEGTVRWSLWLTLYAALIATAIAFIFGVPLAYVLARREFRGKSFIEGLIDIPIVFPHTAAGVALLMVYGQDGILGRLLAPLGITFTDSVPGIVVAMMFVSLPFLVDTAREAFALVDPRYEQLARTLGASPGVAFLRTTLPMARRGVSAGVVMMWARGISEFGAVVILAYNPKIVPVLVYERFEGFGLDAAQPVAVLIVLVALVVFVVLRTVLAPRRRPRRSRVVPEPAATAPAQEAWAGAATVPLPASAIPEVATAVPGSAVSAAGPSFAAGLLPSAVPEPGVDGDVAGRAAEGDPAGRRWGGEKVLLEGLEVRADDFRAGPLDLYVEEGEYFVLLGPSGTGKTVILETLAGLRTPAAGGVRLGDTEAGGLPPEQRGVGFVYQDSLLFPNLDVAANIAFGFGPRSAGAWMTGARRNSRIVGDPRVAAAAALAGASHLLRRDAVGLSGGEQQRVALARALATEPRLLLLDEPLANLDQETRESLQLMLRSLHARFPTTVLHVTHDFPEATVLADRCAVLGDGRVHQVGTPSDVFRRPADAFVARFAGGRNVFTGIARPAGLPAAGVAAPSSPAGVSPGSPTAGDPRAGAEAAGGSAAATPAGPLSGAAPADMPAAPSGSAEVAIDGGPSLLSVSSLRGPVGVLVRPEDIELIPAPAGERSAAAGATPSAGAGIASSTAAPSAGASPATTVAHSAAATPAAAETPAPVGALSVSTTVAEQNELEGVVEDVIDQGGTAFVRVAVPPAFTALLTRRQLEAAGVERGGRVQLRFPAASVHLFPAEGAGPAGAVPTDDRRAPLPSGP
jgi:ABC-type sulfate transport system permease component/ABC-type sugar transport system ATPase subunit